MKPFFFSSCFLIVSASIAAASSPYQPWHAGHGVEVLERIVYAPGINAGEAATNTAEPIEAMIQGDACDPATDTPLSAACLDEAAQSHPWTQDTHSYGRLSPEYLGLNEAL
jgi:hypothetical protein